MSLFFALRRIRPADVQIASSPAPCKQGLTDMVKKSFIRIGFMF